MLATKLSSREALQEVRGKAKELLSAQKRRIYVCAGTACVAGGALDIYAEFKRLLKEADIPCLVKLEEDIEESARCGVALKKSGCPGFCQKGPLVRIDPEGWLYTKVRPEDCADIVERSIKGGEVLERLLYHEEGKAYDRAEEIPAERRALRGKGRDQLLSLRWMTPSRQADRRVHKSSRRSSSSLPVFNL